MPRLNSRDLAESYGWSFALINSDKSLKRLFARAVAGTWTPEKFQAELHNTAWFKKHGEAYRQWAALTKTDGATARDRFANAKALVNDAAKAMGAVLSGAQLKRVTTNYVQFGWDESLLRDTLAQYVKWQAGPMGGFHGQAGADENAIRQVANANGLRYSNSTYQKWIQQVAGGNLQVTNVQDRIRAEAAMAFPGFGDQLKAGMDLADVASPYTNSMAQILELNAQDLDMFDPTLRKALQGSKDAKGQPTGPAPLWQFEQDLRHDSRWLQTKNSQDSLMNATRRVLTDMGLVA